MTDFRLAIPRSNGLFQNHHSVRGSTANVYQNGLSVYDPPGSSPFLNRASVEPLSNRCLIPADSCSPADTVDEWVVLERGAEHEATILAHEGVKCLSRPEYQLQDSLINTPISSLADLSPYHASPPPSSGSPDSVLSQDESVFSNTEKTPSLKKFKCQRPGCSYAADRQDHVRDHDRAHHRGIYYVCDDWCVPNCLFSIIATNLDISVTRNMFTRGISPPIHHATPK